MKLRPVDIKSLRKQQGFLLNPYRFGAAPAAAVPKRKTITIAGATGAGTNYQILLKVGESSGSVSLDFYIGTTTVFPSATSLGDVQFLASDLVTQVPAWVEQVTGVTPNRVAWIWLKVAEDLGTNKLVHCVYNNPTVSQTPDGNNVFELFDDFTAGTFDAAKWAYNSGSGGMTFSGGELTLTGNNTFRNLVSVATYPDGREVVGRKSPSNTTNATVGLFGFNGAIRTDKDWDTAGKTEMIWYTNAAAATRVNLDASYTAAFHRIRIRRSGGVGSVLFNDVVKASVAANVNTAAKTIWLGGAYDTGLTDITDWIGVKKYQVTEPAFSSAGDETATTAPAMSVGLRSGVVNYYSLNNDTFNPIAPTRSGLYEPLIGWSFVNGRSQGDWTTPAGSTCVITKNANTITAASNGADPYIRSPLFYGPVSGATYRYIHLKIKRLAGATWDGTIYYQTSGHGESASYRGVFSSDPSGGAVTGNWVYAVADMHTLVAGGTDWAINNITQIRLDTGNTAADSFEIDSVLLSNSATSPTLGVDGITFESSSVGDKRALFNNGRFITLPDAVGTTGTFSLAVWVTGSGYLYSKGTGANWGVLFYDTATTVEVSVATSSPVQAYSRVITHGIALGTPRLYLLEFDNTAHTLTLSVNNGALSSIAAGTNLRGTTDVYFGIGHSAATWDSPRTGTMEKVVFWNRVLTAGERTELYNGGLGVTF